MLRGDIMLKYLPFSYLLKFPFVKVILLIYVTKPRQLLEIYDIREGIFDLKDHIYGFAYIKF